MRTFETRTRSRHSTRPRLGLVNAFTCWILRTPGVRRLADHQVVELRYTGGRTGSAVHLPVMYAQSGDQLVVLVGGPERKRWWLNFRQPRPVEVLLRGSLRRGIASVATGLQERSEAAAVYAARCPDLPVADDPLVVITLDEPGAAPTADRRLLPPEA